MNVCVCLCRWVGSHQEPCYRWGGLYINVNIGRKSWVGVCGWVGSHQEPCYRWGGLYINVNIGRKSWVCVCVCVGGWALIKNLVIGEGSLYCEYRQEVVSGGVWVCGWVGSHQEPCYRWGGLYINVNIGRKSWVGVCGCVGGWALIKNLVIGEEVFILMWI